MPEVLDVETVRMLWMRLMNQKNVFGIPPGASKANLVRNVRISLPSGNSAFVCELRLHRHIRDDEARMHYRIEDLFVNIWGACRTPVDDSCLKGLAVARHGRNCWSDYGLIGPLEGRAERHGHEDLIARFISHERVVVRQWVQVWHLQSKDCLQLRKAGDMGAGHWSASDGPFPRRHAIAAMTTLPPADELPAPSPARVDYPEVLASAIPTLQASLVLHLVRLLAVDVPSHRYLLCKSACVYRFRCRPAAVSPGALTPAIDAATAQPTRQSSQWLSGLDGLGRHS
jgi:hypothetical protein